MNRWEFAVRRYRQIVPKPVPYLSEASRRQIDVWISDDVCPVVEDFSRRPTFREFASWPIHSLRPDAETAERRLIDAIQQSIGRCARSIRGLANAKRVRRRLGELYPPRLALEKETVEITANGVTPLNRVFAMRDELPIELHQLDQLAKPPERELVCIEDYFEPALERDSIEGEAPIQRGDLIVSVNPELHAIGNFVVRCLFRRLETCCKTLESMRQKCVKATRGLGRVFQPHVERIEQSWTELQRHVRELRVACQTERSVLRDSCVILTQVYAAFHPCPELTWLGLPSHAVDQVATTLRFRLDSLQNAEMTERIAAALADLRAVYDDRPPELSAREEAIAAGGLVLSSNPRTVHWETQEIPGPWHDTLWNFLQELARKARREAAVFERDLYDDARSASIMSTNANRLRSRLPASLRRLIVPGMEARSYRLTLEPYRIHLV